MNFGVIGNGKSAALIDDKAKLVWACLPDFNSASVFAHILDDKKGGHLDLIVSSDYTCQQKYLQNTNILRTVFESDEHAFEVLDFMPRFNDSNNDIHNPAEIIRYIRPIKGKPVVKVDYYPRLAYARYESLSVSKTNYIKTFTKEGGYESLYLYTDIPFETILQKKDYQIQNGCFILLSYNQKLLEINNDYIYLEYSKTKVYWLSWASKTIRYKKYNDQSIRSALVLKLLSYEKTGAILAAVTTSLPETIGEVRNWDYRFCWIRDASMIVSVLAKIGHEYEAERFLDFITSAITLKDEKMQIMYGIRGERDLEEIELDWLAGYKNSKPVRIGNAAVQQKQNDIYGVLLDVIYQKFSIFGNALKNSEDLWTITRSLVRRVIDHWQEADMGIWEFRTQKKHFVFSKVLCWVAMDRASKIAELLHQNEYKTEWDKHAHAIKEDVITKGWNAKIQAFTQAYENDVMDAANLLMEPYGFLDASDERYIATVKKIDESLCQNGLMYRYKNPDDFGEPTSSFTVCSFWMVRALYVTGQKQKAVKMFESLLSYSNHLGLYSEDLDFSSKEQLGNFPQGYSHLALIDIAMLLSNYEVEDDDLLVRDLEHDSILAAISGAGNE